MFIAGDTHQRIYDHQVALGSLGINIRGRFSRLTLSYRTTKGDPRPSPPRRR
jgi:hypothetical protein